MPEHLFDIVARHASEAGARTAISKWVPGHGFVETSYGELACKARRFALVCAQWTSPRTVLPMLVGKGADSIAFMLGAVAAGRPFCFLSPKYRAPQVAEVLQATGSPVAVLDATGVMALRGAWKDHPRFAATKWILLGDRPQTKIYARAEAELLEAASTIRVDDGEADDAPLLPGREPEAGAVGTCLFTSGSTGTPKGVLIGEADLLERMRAEIEWFGLVKEDVLLSILPVSFDVGLNQLMTSLGVGAELVLLDSWLPADVTAVSGMRRVTGISGVPAIWQDVINAGARFEKGGVHASLRYVTVSGGSLPRDLLQKLRQAMPGVQIFKTYGQTEAFRSTSLRPEDYDRKPDSVGKPFTGARVYVVRDDLSRCDAGEIGEVVHSGLGMMMGYLGSARATDESGKLRKNPFHGEQDPSPMAVFTGDLGFLDEEGYLYLQGRRDSMLKVMGNRVYPQEIANRILALDDVREAVVAGVTDAGGQAKLLAFIAASPGSGLSAGAVRRALNASLPTFMVPKEIVFVNRVPRTPSGKPDQRRLIEEYSAGTVRASVTSDEALVGGGA